MTTLANYITHTWNSMGSQFGKNNNCYILCSLHSSSKLLFNSDYSHLSNFGVLTDVTS